jgi:hypothetical protein
MIKSLCMQMPRHGDSIMCAGACDRRCPATGSGDHHDRLGSYDRIGHALTTVRASSWPAHPAVVGDGRLGVVPGGGDEARQPSARAASWRAVSILNIC